MTSVLNAVREKSIWYTIGFAAILCLCISCAPIGKPSYLTQWKTSPNKNRWEVVKIDPYRLSTDEKALFQEQGMPKFVIHFWSAPGGKAVYQWVYENPLRFYRFVDGKRTDDVSVKEYDPWWR
jgi:hypothetical protein